jgi:hypothetical protein
MTHYFPLALVLLAAACGYAETDYVVEEAEAACVFTVECYPGLHDSVDDCIVVSQTVAPAAGCSFDSAAAQECVEGIEAMACPEEGAAPSFPAACDAVYTECGAET